MIKVDKFQLDNGLKVLVHEDRTTPLVVINTLYDVGARDENPNRTGFAHLFEHLMFGGSVNIPEFDTPLQLAGGENNAFTSNDITNYYDVLPKENIETALWLESDRMLSLAFTPKSLEVQRQVVIEEFKQRYLNQPYGDVWLELRPLVYNVHPYQWATIGKNIEQIETATMEEVKAFFNKHYTPSNAILCLAGNISVEEAKPLVEKWYQDIPSKEKPVRDLPKEPEQKEFREKTIVRDVPSNAFYYAFRMVDRKHDDYFTADVISDIFGRDKSSRLFVALKKEQQLVSDINAYIMGSIDDGLLIVSGKLNDGVSFEALDKAIWEQMDKLGSELIDGEEFNRILAKIRTAKEFQEQGILNRAMNLSYYELISTAEDINTESDKYNAIHPEDIKRVAQYMLTKENCSLLKVVSNHVDK